MTQKLKLSEKMSTLFPSRYRGTSGASGESLTPSPPSPADDPLDRLDSYRNELKSVSDDPEDTGQFHVSKAGVTAQGIPRWAMGLFAGIVALAVLVIAVALASHWAH